MQCVFSYTQWLFDVALTDSNQPLPSGKPSGRWCETWHWQTQNLPLPSGRPSDRWCFQRRHIVNSSTECEQATTRRQTETGRQTDMCTGRHRHREGGVGWPEEGVMFNSTLPQSLCHLILHLVLIHRSPVIHRLKAYTHIHNYGLVLACHSSTKGTHTQIVPRSSSEVQRTTWVTAAYSHVINTTH